jgi:hypothetical protein
MAELSGSSEDQVEDDVAEFRAALSRLREDHRRVLLVLVPRLAAMQERGDTEGALALVAKIHEILSDPDRPLQ